MATLAAVENHPPECQWLNTIALLLLLIFTISFSPSSKPRPQGLFLRAMKFFDVQQEEAREGGECTPASYLPGDDTVISHSFCEN